MTGKEYLEQIIGKKILIIPDNESDNFSVRLGELMFKFHDTNGVPREIIHNEIEKYQIFTENEFKKFKENIESKLSEYITKK